MLKNKNSDPNNYNEICIKGFTEENCSDSGGKSNIFPHPNTAVNRHTPEIMQFKTRKMNNITQEDLPQRVSEMHSLLLLITSELSHIKKQLNIQRNKFDASLIKTKFIEEEEDQDEDFIASLQDVQDSASMKIMRNNIYQDESNVTSLGSLYDGMKNYQPVFRERESFSSLSGNLYTETKQPLIMNQLNNSLNGPTKNVPQKNTKEKESFSAVQMTKQAETPVNDDFIPDPDIGRPPSPFLIIADKMISGPVILNVGGKKHEVRWDTLDKFPTSRLGRLRHCVTHRGLKELCDAYSLQRREYYFDRSPRNFDAILGLYRTNKLHLSQGVCVQDFCEELEYWGLNDLHLEPCCQHTYYRARWLLPSYGIQDDDLEEEFGSHYYSRVQKQLWNLFENPHDSCAAKVVAVVSCMFVVVSTLCLIFSTLPKFQQKDQNGIVQEEDFFEIAEAVFVGWFTFEYVIRFIAAPHKLRFIKGGMNIIDLLGILPYFASLCLSLVTTSTPVSEGGINGSGLGNSTVPSGHLGGASGGYQDEMRRIAQIFRIMRILRIFKLARHITGLQTLGMTLKNSYKELGLLMLVVIMGMLIFSGLAYVSEKDTPDTKFISMPQALYWAIITMTSVGYGDISPTTWFGKLVGSACAICGVLCISLPIPIIVNNFNKFYEKAKIEEEITAKKKKSAWDDCQKDSEGGGKAENGESGYKVVMNGRRPSQMVQPQHERRSSQLPHPHPHPPNGSIISNHNKTKQQEGVHLNKF